MLFTIYWHKQYFIYLLTLYAVYHRLPPCFRLYLLLFLLFHLHAFFTLLLMCFTKKYYALYMARDDKKYVFAFFLFYTSLLLWEYIQCHSTCPWKQIYEYSGSVVKEHFNQNDTSSFFQFFLRVLFHIL